MQNGQLYLQVHWEPVTKETAGGSLPTPLATVGNRRAKFAQGGTPLLGALLPTPTVCNDSMYYDKSPKKDKRHSKGLATELMDLQMLPTPRTRDYKGHQKEGYQERGYGPTLPDIIRQLPTPSANEHKYSMSKEDHQSGTCLAAMARKDRLSAPTGKPMSLNPAFVEEMMGYPIGHTDLKH